MVAMQVELKGPICSSLAAAAARCHPPCSQHSKLHYRLRARHSDISHDMHAILSMPRHCDVCHVLVPILQTELMGVPDVPECNFLMGLLTSSIVAIDTSKPSW